MYSVASKIENQREFGAYYTPKHLSQILCHWAIKSKTDLILEPGFGGCDFLASSSNRLSELGNKQASKQIFGCDIDKKAFEHLAEKIGPIQLDKRFILSDFLELKPGDFEVSEFDAVIGNPPYVSMHNMSLKQLERARALEFDGITIGGRASLWAYFILHALSFLRLGGRCAWVLPSSYVNADYSQNLHKYICSRFDRVLMIPIKERLFTSVGVKESTVLVLADGWHASTKEAHCSIIHADSSCELNEIIQSWDQKRATRRVSPSPNEQATASAKKLLLSLYEEGHCLKLSDVAFIRIGIVTGANRYFILDKSSAKENRIPPRALKPILAKLAQVNGLSLNESILEANVDANFRCLLLNTVGSNKYDAGVKNYLLSFSTEDRQAISTFKRRCTWHQPDDGLVPDAFLSYMCNAGPKLVLNDARTTSTNTIHRVYFRERFSITQQKLFAISALSSLGQLSAELVGRSYGSGVLKLEPNEATEIVLANPSNIHHQTVGRTFAEVDLLLRVGSLELAEQRANELVLKPILQSSYEYSVSQLRQAIIHLRNTRKGI